MIDDSNAIDKKRQLSAVFPFNNQVSLADWPHQDGQLAILEEAKMVEHRQPAFVLNLSGEIFSPWISARQDIHGSYLV